MSKQEPVAREQPRSKRDEQRETDRGTDKNGHGDEVASYEQELADYLQDRIKPGLNRGAIPLLARSIAKEIAHWERPNGASEDTEVEDEHSAEGDEEYEAEAEADDDYSAEADDDDADDEDSAEADEDDADDEDSAEADEDDADDEDDEDSAERKAPPDFEADMHELQAELGEDWILHFSVHGDEAWLTAEKADGSQRVEGPTADVILQAVELLDEGGGRSS